MILFSINYIRKGDITELSVHAIVHSTNEKMTDRSYITEKLFAKAGPKLKADIKNNIRGNVLVPSSKCR
jgi:O-acetyl-ADP-ribose deacetylase (regulator of RNase III)